MHPDQERRLTFVPRFWVQEPKSAPNTYRRSGSSRRRTSWVPTCRLNQIRSSTSVSVSRADRPGADHGGDPGALMFFQRTDRSARSIISWDSGALGVTVSSSRSSRSVSRSPVAPPRPLFQLSGRLVRRVRKELLWIERLSLLEDRVDNPTELLGDERHRFAFAVA